MKVFTLPDGRVEQGSYKLDQTKQPHEIDSTTDGRAASERGIYAVEGNTLKLCMATGGEPRPQDFTTAGSHNLLIVFRRENAEQTVTAPVQAPAGKRKFRMGFTGFVYDMSLEAVTASRKFVRGEE